MTSLSILDLVRVTQETDARGAFDNARDLARTPNAGAIAASGWPSITTCRASPAPRPPS